MQMFTCNRCERNFQKNWQLQRHFSRKIPCKLQLTCAPVKTPDETIKSPQQTIESPQQTIESPQQTMKSPDTCCKYCLKTFARSQNLKNHSCKMKDDKVRKLEIQLNKKIEPWSSNMCRFCRYEGGVHISRHLKTCKARKRYHEKLESELKEQQNESSDKHVTINNVNNINNTIVNNNSVNIIVNPIGQEDYSYITCSQLKSLSRKMLTDEEFLAKTLTYIHAHPKHPENHNIIVTNHRSNMAFVKWKDHFEYRSIESVMQKAAINMLDKVCLEEDYDELPTYIKKKYESVTDNDELDSKAASLFKLDLYAKLKSGHIVKPGEQIDGENAISDI